MTSHTKHDQTPSDAEAIAASVTRPAAFDTVFERHLAVVHAFAYRRVGANVAEDVTAETFARAFAKRDRYDPAHVSARPWLLGIAANIIGHHWRAERRQLLAYARAARADRPPGPSIDDSDALAAVARLPRRQREVVLLHAWADLTYEEIARALGVPIGTVRSRLARARARLAGDLATQPVIAPLHDVKESPNA